MKRVLVTGASGFVGYQSLAPLVARGFDVIAVTSRTVNLPIPFDETNNPKFVQCIDRNP